jgi:hypothetical protein
MKLFEEFKEYENMWDSDEPVKEEFRSEYQRLMSTPEGRAQLDAMDVHDRYRLSRDDMAVDPFYVALEPLGNDIEMEYDDFTYTWDTVGVFEAMRDDILPKHASKEASGPNAALIAEYQKFEKAWEEAKPGEEENRAAEEEDLFIAKNLGKFIEIFNEELLDHFADQAYEWYENDSF